MKKRKRKVIPLTGKRIGKIIAAATSVIALKAVRETCATRCNFPKCTLKGCMIKSKNWE